MSRLRRELEESKKKEVRLRDKLRELMGVTADTADTAGPGGKGKGIASILIVLFLLLTFIL